ncbi:MAG: pyruvate dehydrogenase (acetyl-transferring) E1 component subunit alpha, partial [Microbacterium sp.]|nr:pyruvate dehydrogenase (acetyl-transferring) E1 component subunit alpha [Microbacterium sp.]
ADELGAAVRAACLSMTSAEPLSILDRVYAEPHSGLDEQRVAFAAYLDGFESAAEGQGVGR